jgi:8-oxo-dGTP pyrophosphatase MutT (NUDIX family)
VQECKNADAIHRTRFVHLRIRALDMRYLDVIDRLATALIEPLPGAGAQSLMAPRPRRTWAPGLDPSRPRHAAGLLLVFPLDDLAHIVLTVRSEHVRHRGQVSLPGGVIEPGETIQGAALREAHEEIALATDDVRVLGQLTPIDIPVSGFRLHPVVAALDRRPELFPADREVARIAEVPVAALLEAPSVAPQRIARDGSALDVPCFAVDNLVIWGATAMVLAEFLILLGWAHQLEP